MLPTTAYRTLTDQQAAAIDSLSDVGNLRGLNFDVLTGMCTIWIGKFVVNVTPEGVIMAGYETHTATELIDQVHNLCAAIAHQSANIEAMVTDLFSIIKNDREKQAI